MIKYIYMFDLNNNNISTILLLVVLGLLIWYLTKPNRNKENFTENTQVSPSSKFNDNYGSINSSDLLNPQMTQPPVLSTQSHMIQELPLNTSLSEDVSSVPVIQSSKIEKSVNDFQSFDGNYDDTSGADINDAFQPPIPSTNTIISAIDINKKNVQDYNAKDFLPKEINNQWFDTDFSQAKTNIEDDKLINTERYVIGINTVGQSLKNASYDIRGTIANPKYSVSPWNNSTYEPDYNIKPLC